MIRGFLKDPRFENSSSNHDMKISRKEGSFMVLLFVALAEVSQRSRGELVEARGGSRRLGGLLERFFCYFAQQITKTTEYEFPRQRMLSR